MKNQPSKHLAFPFVGKAQLTIKHKTRVKKIEVEIATSEIEIFQSACYRSSKDLDKPLVLVFDNPTIQSFTLQNYITPVEQILVESDSYQVVGIFWLKSQQVAGSHIQGFTGLSFVILANPGFAEANRISLDDTTITINK
ncbi:MAG: hypothetical protein FJX80_02735 [Bacteroidetes bacterium]|nr:hypothetical protein [Bacteroidota bacterium]